MGRRKKFSDRDLLEILMKNARMAFVDIAKKFGVSETTIRKRISKLEAEGIIRGYTIDVDPRKLGFNVVAIVGVDTEPQNYVSVIAKLKSMDEIKKLYTSSGDHMIMFEGWFKNSDEFIEFIEKIRQITGVTKVCPAVILERIK